MVAEDIRQTVVGWRRIAALLGFLQKYEVERIFRRNPFRPADPSLTPFDLWRAGKEACAALPPLDPDLGMQPLSESLKPQAEEVVTRYVYKTVYEVLADYQFGMAPIAALLAAQWEADMDYVDELGPRLPPSDDERAIFALAFDETKLTDPIVQNSQVVFSTHRRNLANEVVPRITKVEEGVYDVSLRTLGRPNYVQVGIINNRMILLNGVHKTLALYRAGLTHIPCIWRRMNNLRETGIAVDQSTLYLPELLEGPRPALVIDFLNPAVANPVLVRAMDSVLKITFTVDKFLLPAPEE
jgi:hypothetical protein